MTATTITASGNDVFRVSGVLTFATARDVLQLSQSLFAPAARLHIDLSAVEGVDSAGLALLIEWYRAASFANKTISFSNVPAQLHTLAKIGDVDQLLRLNEAVAS